METISLTVSDEAQYLDPEHIAKAEIHALKVSTKWLASESVNQLGIKLRIKKSAGRRRVKSGRVKGSEGSVWFGIRPLNVAYIRDYSPNDKGVISGDRFYRGAFVQSINGSEETIFRRTAGRQRISRPRHKPLPKGQRRARKSPPIEVVREDFDADMVAIIGQLETELTGIFKEAFFEYFDSLH